MWRKLTSLLFEEEEVVLEEEEVKVENISIKPVEVMKEEPIKNYNLEDTVEIKAVENIIIEEETVQEVPVKEEPKKSFRIDLDDTPEQEPEVAKEKPVIKIYDQEKTEASYRSKSILSPMHGGSEEVASDTPVVAPKKPSSITQVISPMYGSVSQDDTAREVLSETMMDINLEKMIDEEEGDDEIQTSLYDFLEGLDDNAE